ncbi:MAG: DUF5752 family protein [Endomicrobiales bacterium]|nr:DUF5752 family protein [Endomicrobiales bacterium]
MGKKAKNSFQFYTRLHLSEATGLKAETLNELLEMLKIVPGSSIYHHTHRFLQQHQFYSPEPPNDFAYWVRDALGEDELAESVASIDIVQFSTIRELREEIISRVEKYINQNTTTANRVVKSNKIFYFVKSTSFIIRTPYVVNNLNEFCEALKKISINSLYFHIFESRLRLENESNDFSRWVEMSLGNKELASAISNIDPYTFAMEDLRKIVIKLVEKAV